MKARKLISLVAAGIVIGSGWSAHAQQDLPPGATLVALANDLEHLNDKISTALVRVSVTESAASVLDSVMLKADFEQWLKAGTPGMNNVEMDRNGGGGGRRGGGGPQGQAPGGPGGFGRGPDRGGAPGNLSMQVRAFLMMQADQQDKANRPTEAAQLRGLALRVEINRGVFQGDMSAMILDDNGHALLLTGLLREAHTGSAKPIDVTLPDGTKTTASFVGSNLTNNYSIVKLEKPGNGAKHVRFAGKKIMPGQLLVSRSVGPGAAALVMASGRPGETFSEDRLIFSTEDRSGTFVFTIDGELASVVTSGGAFGPERFALSASRLQREINYMIKQGKDIEPRDLGVKFSNVSPSTAPAGGAAAGKRRTLQVTAVAQKSPAAAAGLKDGDILVEIDGQPVSELVNSEGWGLPRLTELRTDFATRTDDVPLEIIRDGKDVKLTMPLK